MSRCTTPALCAAASAEATCTAISSSVAWIHSPTLQRRTQRRTFNELRRYEVPVPLRADLVNGKNIRMIQGRGGARLAFKAVQLRLVRRQPLWEKLERDFAPESLVSGQKHFAHSTDADEGLDPVMTDQFPHYRAGPVVGQKFGSNFEGR